MNTLTDAEIVKALKICADYFDCDGCPYEAECSGLGNLTDNTLDLINRQKAEIERLEKAIKVQDIMIGNQDLKRKGTKNEAIKEFAKRLKDKADTVSSRSYGDLYEIEEYEIDDLVKEMVGE